ncbi:serine hydrolase domain-containing protein [Streptomyces lichenis]|uniref:Beta-lactamase family protein n=1 Tax=Streptomyces lichenis TaxID=2306967 RepID=A0ABT0IH80_9ACTN|nr:serine hydrolase domain-containing protein [Streptomyces lichenis]MCK8680680.1 beta-lactamase family protein [Streptomyces lichenis]
MRADIEHWADRLAALAADSRVPGASLAFWYEGETHACATGVLNTATGAAARTDSLFQIGSVTKVWTATQLMLLVEEGRLTLDTPVAEVLPEFRVRDPGATAAITPRHLLTHTSGIDGDLFLDTGRGDDCLRRYVEACAELEQTFPVGDAHSYGNSGFVIAGRLVERLTGRVWDQDLRERICEPLGLTHTWTLPEDVLRFGAAVGHDEHGAVVERWSLPRSVGPAGLICARAADVVAFGRAHLTPGALLADPAALRRPQVDLVNPHTGGRQWGIGWSLDEWDGHRVVSHTGDTIGQHAVLWMLPELGTVIAALVNGGRSVEFQHRLAAELLRELHAIEVPAPLAPPERPVEVDLDPLTGVYERAGSRIQVTAHQGRLRLRTEPTGLLAGLARPRTLDLVAVDATTFLGRDEGEAVWDAVVFERRPDGPAYLHYSGRATPRTG